MLFLFVVLLAIFQGLVGLKCDQYDYVDPIIGSSGKGFGFIFLMSLVILLMIFYSFLV